MDDKRDDGKRAEHQTPEPDENTTYKERTTVTRDEHRRVPSPPQESGTTHPKT